MDQIENLDNRLSKMEDEVDEMKDNVTKLTVKQEAMEEWRKVAEINISSVQEMTGILKESIIKQDATNEYLQKVIGQNSELIEKLDSRQQEFQKIQDDRYIEIIKANATQDKERIQANAEQDKENSKEKFLLSTKALYWIIGILCFLVTTLAGVLLSRMVSHVFGG